MHGLHPLSERNFYGSDSFLFRVSAQNSSSANEEVSIVINPINDAPLIELDVEEVKETLLVDKICGR